MSKRQEVIDSIAEKLTNIKIINGYSSDIGFKVSKGTISDFDYTDEVPFLFLVDVNETQISSEQPLTVPGGKVELFLQILCFYHRSEINPHDEGREIIADVLKSLFSEEIFTSNVLWYIDSQIDTEEIGSQYISIMINLKVNYFLNLCNP